MQVPLFSIIVTSYNREKYIAETLDSILSQSISNYELILVDDCSIDETYEIALSFKNQFTSAVFFKNEKNIGQFKNRNFAASLATGDFFLYVDSDDTIKDGSLSYLSQVVSKYKDVDFFLINKIPNTIECMRLSPQEAYNHHFYKKSILHIGPGGTLIKRSLFYKINGFPICYGAVGDLYYNLMAAANSNILLLDFDFLNYRRHPDQEINKHYDYLIYGYKYFIDILSMPSSPLVERERKRLVNKSKRRFLINCFRYAFKVRSLKIIPSSMKKVGFSFSDIFIALIA
jgi:glycosyltransferase involved in cell wall biosynthesis